MSKTENISSKVEWNKVDWRKAEAAAFKLQKRIYQASQRGNLKQVRQLQKTLVQSWYAKLIATRRVTQENKGKKTAGVDGIKSLTPEQRIDLAKTLKLDGKAKPAKRVWIPKPGKAEKRPLGIPVMEDRAKQCLLKMALEPQWEALFEVNSYGFRPGRSCHDAIKSIFDNLRYKPKFVLDADIARCFDKIDHSKLLDKINSCPKFKRQIKAWLKSGAVEKRDWFPTTEGTPQGGVISPLLANIALHGMEQHIKEAFPEDKAGYIKGSKKTYKRYVTQPVLIRYADDFVIMCEEQSVIQKCQEIIEQWLSNIGLELKPSKTRLTHTLNHLGKEKPGFDFLGFKVRQFIVGKHHSGKHKGQLLGYKTIIKPSKSKIKEHYNAIAEVIQKFNGKSQAELIGKLNPIIRGWSNYQAPWHSKKTFNGMDNLVFLRLQRWAKRRHPNKNKKWVASKYWRIDSEGQWIFSPNERRTPTELVKHSSIKAGFTYKKVEGKRSPYDGDFIYWGSRMGDSYLTMEPQKARLLKRQKGRCAECGLYFKPDDVIEKHHLTHKSKGGSNADNNLELVHLHCHDKIHASPS